MDNTTKIPAIYGAINKIAAELAAPKDKTNSFGKYKYRDLPTLRNALKPLLLKYGVFIIPSATKASDGQREVLTMNIRCISTEDGSEVTSQLSVNCDDHKGMSAEQASGAALTYAEKYLVCMVFHVDDDSDTIDPEDDILQRNDQQAYVELLNKAINELRGAKTMDDLIKVNAKYRDFRDNEDYLAEGRKRKEAIEAAAENASNVK